MPADTTIDLGRVNIGDVDRFRVTIKKDGIAWNLSSGSVAITFEKPDRSTQFSRSMTGETPVSGIFYYDTVITDIDAVGWWTLRVRVTDGSIQKSYPHEIGFYAGNEP